MITKKDCVFYNTPLRCAVLITTNCNKCAFFMTEEEAQNKRKQYEMLKRAKRG